MRIPIISNILERRNLGKFADYMDWLAGESATNAPVVTEQTALQSSGVYACVRILSESVASLPLHVYERLEPRGKRRAGSHPLYALLHDAPNPYMTAFTFREVLMSHLLTWGNAYAEIEWERGQVKALWPLLPNRMVDIKVESGGLMYYYQTQDGAGRKLPAYRVLHIAGLGFDGIRGYSPIRMASKAISLSLSTEEYGNKFFTNGARPSGVLEHPGKLKPEGRINLEKSWSEMHKGLDNAHRVAILEEGMKYNTISVPPEEAQFLQTRKYQLNEIARLYRVPPHMLADLDKATFSNIEHQGIEFVTHTLRPWLVRWEQQLRQKLFLPDERQKFYAEFSVDGLLRGDTVSRFQAYATARQWGWMSADDVREIENLNPLPEGQGDIYLIPMNMMPATKAEEVSVGNRELRSNPQGRAKLASAYQGMYTDAISRIVNREVANIRQNLKKLSRDERDFTEWLTSYYSEPAWMNKIMTPVSLTFSSIIAGAASQEVGADSIDVTVQAKGMADNYVSRHSTFSRNQILAIMKESPQNEWEENIEERLDGWSESRAEQASANETVYASNFIAKVVFAAAGFLKLRWIAQGGNNCPYCSELDGRVVGIEQSFVGEGENLQSEDGRMNLYKPTMHPPLHKGCVCQVVPE